MGARLVLALGLGFAVLLDDVADGEGIATVDRPALAWLAAHRAPDLTTAVTLLTQLGSPVGVAVIAALVGGLISMRRRSGWPPVLAALGAGGIGVTNLAVKAVTGRHRPPNALAVVGEDGFSFPSGHTTTATVVGVLSAWMLTHWVLTARVARAGVWTAAAMLVGAVGASRIYRGVHYPSDVLAGWALGAARAVAIAVAVMSGDRTGPPPGHDPVGPTMTPSSPVGSDPGHPDRAPTMNGPRRPPVMPVMPAPPVLAADRRPTGADRSDPHPRPAPREVTPGRTPTRAPGLSTEATLDLTTAISSAAIPTARTVRHPQRTPPRPTPPRPTPGMSRPGRTPLAPPRPGHRGRGTARVRPRHGLRRTTQIIGALGGVCAAAAVALLLITPSVGDAVALTHAAQHRHGTSEPAQAATSTPFTTALIATEDARFLSHHGIDSHGILRAAAALLTGATADPGGSTLDQQLVKQLYFDDREGGVRTTAAQLGVAVKLDAHYSKPEILDMHTDVVYLGHGFYGLDAAAHGYFGITPGQLSRAQAALLAGMVAAPTDYDPLTHLDLARERQHHVLARLVDTATLTVGKAAARAPLHLTP